VSNDDIKWIIDKLENMGDKQDKFSEVLTKLVMSLDSHVQKTNKIELELEPIKKHVIFVNNSVKLLTVLGSLVMGARHLGIF
jgi:hypothetical protein